MEKEAINLDRLFELATTNKEYVNSISSHELENEFLEDYAGDFEMIGSMLTGGREQKTNIRFEKIDDYEKYVNAIVVDYDSQDVNFTK